MNKDRVQSVPIITSTQMVEVDRIMIEEYGVQLIQMMENAGRNLAEQARRMLGGQVVNKAITVLCGAGNNGGGGMVAARHLDNWGAHVQALLASDTNKLKKVPAHQWRSLQTIGIVTDHVPDLARADLILDALIGYGLTGDPRDPAATWIERINAAGRPVLALDTPSGLNLQTGTPGTPCVQATATLTLALPKAGLLTSQARTVVGDLYLADISVPPQLYRRFGLDVGPVFATDAIVPLAAG